MGPKYEKIFIEAISAIRQIVNISQFWMQFLTKMLFHTDTNSNMKLQKKHFFKKFSSYVPIYKPNKNTEPRN